MCSCPNNRCLFVAELNQNHCPMNIDVEKVKSIAMDIIRIRSRFIQFGLVFPIIRINIINQFVNSLVVGK
jgi:hypothetical protein